jgi:hypothetical protein
VRLVSVGRDACVALYHLDAADSHRARCSGRFATRDRARGLSLTSTFCWRPHLLLFVRAHPIHGTAIELISTRANRRGLRV